MTSAPALIRVRFLQEVRRGDFHAAAGEARTMHRAEGDQAIANGWAEPLAPKPAPSVASGSGASAPPERQVKTSARKR